MPELIDQYFLVERRDTLFVNKFLNHYISFSGGADDYYLLQKSEETLGFNKLDDVLTFYEHNIYSIGDVYISNRDKGSLITTAIITYTDDGKAIFGVSVIGTFNDPGELRRNLEIFNDIKLFIGARVACMTLEEPPPNNSIEFIEFAKQRESL